MVVTVLEAKSFNLAVVLRNKAVISWAGPPAFSLYSNFPVYFGIIFLPGNLVFDIESVLNLVAPILLRYPKRAFILFR